MPFKQYFTASRQARYSITFALPLLLLYEALTAALSDSSLAGVRNGADVMLKTVFVAFGGRNGVTAFGVLLIAGGAWLVWHDWRRHPGPLRATVLAGMLLEALVYAALFGFVVSLLTAVVLGRVGLAVVQAPARAALPLAAQLVVSLGAGIYEELLFRVLLVSGILGLARLIGWGRPLALAVAVVGRALIFRAVHYVGALGERLTLASFAFRAVAVSTAYLTAFVGPAGCWTSALGLAAGFGTLVSAFTSGVAASAGLLACAAIGAPCGSIMMAIRSPPGEKTAFQLLPSLVRAMSCPVASSYACTSFAPSCRSVYRIQPPSGEYEGR